MTFVILTLRFYLFLNPFAEKSRPVVMTLAALALL